VPTSPKNTKTFDFNRYADVPQIPRVNDVLYALELSSLVEYYNVCKERKDTHYRSNVAMVIKAVGNKVSDLWSSDRLMEATEIVARTIVDMCPEDAACLRREAYINAKILAGDDVPPKDANVHELRRACICQECRTSSSTD